MTHSSSSELSCPKGALAATLVALVAIATLAAPTAAEDRSGPKVNRPTVLAQESSLAPLAFVPVVAAPSVDPAALAVEDEDRHRRGMPPRFAVPNRVHITPETEGVWEQSDRGEEVWRLRVGSKAAHSLNLGFTRYQMPKGGRLRIYSPDLRSVVRPFTARDNAPHGELWTPVVLAEEIVVEVTVPAGARQTLSLELGWINVGYRGFESVDPNAAPEKSGSCNVDVVCLAGASWRDEIASVGVYSTGGSLFCTGAMVNNTAQNEKPFFLTAAHCGINASNAASLVVYWNYETTACGGTPDGVLVDFQTGAFFRAAYGPSDFTLVELDEAPDSRWGVGYAGWDRRGLNATMAVAIHHPNTDEKRISFEDQPTTVTSYLQNAVPGDGSHVRVADWDLGTTEPGSSGSPLFDQNHRVIGQLHGGFAACGNDDSDWYGRLSASWTGGGTASTRLRDWLDPGNSGAATVDTLVTPPIGGCCNGATCAFEREADCVAGGGIYLGDGAACSTAAGSPTSYSAAVGQAIPDAGGPGNAIMHTINVTDTFDVGDVAVDLQISHTYVGDLSVTLSHLGTTVVLIDRPGVPLSGFGCSADNLDVALDDEGTGGLIESQCQPGLSSPPSYVPQQPLDAFDGLSSVGDWIVAVYDSATQDIGTLDAWGLHLDRVGITFCACATDSDCDDGLFCTGTESCDGTCQAGVDPCPFQGCDESADACFAVACDNNGVCGIGEDCSTCALDCGGSPEGLCGDGTCEPSRGESCESCPEDCNGQTSGNPGLRFCCGDGVTGPNPVTCTDARCFQSPFACSSTPIVEFCCGNLACEGAEGTGDCAIDCAAPTPVPDGAFGTPLQVGRRDESGNLVITLDWDTLSCRAPGYHLLYGALGGVANYAVDGSVCGISNTGTDAWSVVPAGDLWFVLVGEGGDLTESTWGVDGDDNDRGGAAASNQCGFVNRDNGGTCP